MKLSNCPTHAIVADKAKEHVANDDKFLKDDVLTDAGFQKYGHLIQWPYIREQVEAELGERLMPFVAGNGFDPEIHPEKFLPSARHKTDGYARAAAMSPQIAKLYAQRRYNQAIGMIQSTERLLLAFQKQGVPIGFTPAPLPQLTVQP
jgi:hypothetical protein